MPLVGGGGAPNVAGSNPSGIGTSLNYVGDYVYAYNNHIMTDTITTILAFTTGNEIIKGKFSFMGPIAFTAANIASGDTGGLRISMDGQVTAILKSATNPEDMPGVTDLEVIIPPFTTVSCDVLNSSDNNDYVQTLVFAGRLV